jgi:iron(III) transport system permease protein
LTVQSLDGARLSRRGPSIGWRHREGRGLALALAVFILVFSLIPVGRLIAAAFEGGLGAFWQVLDTPDVWRATRNTLVVAFGSGGLALLVGVVFALILSVTTLRARTALAFIMVMSLMIAPQISALAFKTLAGPASPLLKLIGLAPAPGTPNPMLGEFGIILVMGLHHAPLVAITLASGLASIPRPLIEAARLDGASPFQVVSRIMLPLLRPFLLVGGAAGLCRRHGQFRDPGAARVAGGLCHAADAAVSQAREFRTRHDWRRCRNLGLDCADCRYGRHRCEPAPCAVRKPARDRSPHRTVLGIWAVGALQWKLRSGASSL